MSTPKVHAQTAFELNGEAQSVAMDTSTPLLWVLRDELGLVGTKFGCGIGQCGACTVHLDGQPIRSCLLPLSAVTGRKVTTIEGLSTQDEHPIQIAWAEHSVPQCGYCQSGQVMAAAALLSKNEAPTDAEIDVAMSNICRCGSYTRIRRAIHHAAALGRTAEPGMPDKPGQAAPDAKGTR